MSAKLIGLIEGSINNKKVYRKLYAMNIMTSRKLHDALHEIGQDYVKHMEDLMKGPKTGIIYKMKGQAHQASASGEPPAILTGKTFRSLYYEVRNSQELEFGARSAYSGWLEDGTKKMDARPFAQRTIDDQRRDTLGTLLEYTKMAVG